MNTPPDQPALEGSPDCVAARTARVDTACEGGVTWAVVYRTRPDRRIVDVTPGCFPHCIAEADRAYGAGQIATADVELLSAASLAEAQQSGNAPG